MVMRHRLVRCLLAASWMIVGSACAGGDSDMSSPTEPTSPPNAAPFVRVSGTLWRTCRVNPTGPDFYSDPISGVTVSSSLDATTTITDAAGRVNLETRTRPTSDFRDWTVSFNGAGVSFSVSLLGPAIEGQNFSPNQCPRGS